MLSSRPTLKAKYTLKHIPGEGYFLLSENGTFLIEGPVVEAVVPLLDGIRTVDQVLNSLPFGVPKELGYNAIEMLLREGHLEHRDTQVTEEVATLWSEMGIDSAIAQRILAQVSIEIISLGGISSAVLERHLLSLGARIHSPGHCIVVQTSDYLHPALADINEHCLKTSTPWILMKPIGFNIWLGPVLIPYSTACWECLASRLRHNREVEDYIARKTNSPSPLQMQQRGLPCLEDVAYSIAALNILKWITSGDNRKLESALAIFNPVSLEQTIHPIVRRPQCSQCGNPQLAWNADKIKIGDTASCPARDNGERRDPPEVTYERFRHHISSVTGVVNGLYPSHLHGTGPLRVYVAGHNFALKNDSLFFLKDGLRTHSSGKGRTDTQARTSALCEALERYSGLFRGEERRLWATYNDLQDDAIHPNDCMLFSEAQYAERLSWLDKHSRFQVVPLPFEPDTSIEWSPVFSWTDKKTKYLPTSYLYYGYPHSERNFFCWADSNGNASGSTFEDACLQGFYELIERDSVAIWWYNRIRRPRVDLDTFGDPYFSDITSFYKSLNRELWVLDITSDLGIPAFAAVNRRIIGPTQDIILGFGAHHDARIAINRAVTEMNQFMPAVLNVLPDGTTQYAYGDRDAQSWWRTATVENQPYLTPMPDSHSRTPMSFGAVVEPDIAKQLQVCFSTIEQKGMEVIIVNQTRPDIGINVAKVIVPGLRHFWARFAPGRLYDVPVRMGWLNTPLAEAELNPIAMFL